MRNLNRASARFFRPRVLSVLLPLYLLAHLFTLNIHPFVHSDEAWLAVLTRAMVTDRSPAAVEEVFRLTPRYPHALKTLYHLVQAPFISISWSAFAARLPSLIAGMFSLVFITRIASSDSSGEGSGRRFRFIPGLFMALSPQFWYASHLGRQEMLLTAIFLFSWSLKSQKRASWIVALPLSAAVFVHPNAFIISIPIGVMYLLDFFFPAYGRIGKIRELLVFIGVLAGSAALAVGFSFKMDAEFLRHYSSFGDSVGSGDSLLVKLLGFPVFIGKMWRGDAGTYYLADIRGMFILGTAGFFCTILSLFFSDNNRENLSGLLRRKSAVTLLSVPFSLTLGMVLVGKYGPPTITFLMPPAFLLGAYGLSRLKVMISFLAEPLFNKSGTVLVSVTVFLMAASLSWNTLQEISHSEKTPSYSLYRQFLENNIDGEGRVLANLNTAFVYDYDRLVIWRDLEKLVNPGNTGNIAPGEKSLKTFLSEKDVRWIILPDELELIYDSRPVWNALYGNPYWYTQLMDFLENQGAETERGIFPNYAMRIVPYMEKEPWESVIYRIDKRIQ
ncbi:MAG: hypothetical protein DRP60_16970 [Spirochaetes bacterium]|nr:MAG: hypothetical protein DRP60_16970 [Spirochaetota bacterium]